MEKPHKFHRQRQSFEKVTFVDDKKLFRSAQ